MDEYRESDYTDRENKLCSSLLNFSISLCTASKQVTAGSQYLRNRIKGERILKHVYYVFLSPKLNCQMDKGKASLPLLSLTSNFLPNFELKWRRKAPEPKNSTHIDVAIEHGLKILRNYLGHLVNQAHQEAAHSIVS